MFYRELPTQLQKKINKVIIKPQKTFFDDLFKDPFNDDYEVPKSVIYEILKNLECQIY